MASRRENLVGIDLGTTYSSISYLDDNAKPIALNSAEGQLLTPSVVYFEERGGTPIVGQRAVEKSLRCPERFADHAKRFLGMPNKYWDIDGVLYTPTDISALILGKLIADAECEIGKIRRAVVTVPAHFTAHQRQLTIQAGKQAGLEEVSIVNEPVAAALAFALPQVALGEDAGVVVDYLGYAATILVYDLGGGTFDLSIVQYDKNQLRVVAAIGEERLGGIDWDQELVDMIAEPLAVLHGDLRKDPRSLRRLAHSVERKKRRLSVEEATNFTIQHESWEEEFVLERTEFEERTEHLAARTRTLMEELLASCQLTSDDLSCILPVGGATRMPMIRRVIEDFAAERTDVSDNFIRRISPDLSVAEGAALFAGMVHSDGNVPGGGRFSRTLAEYRTSNITTHSLGILVRNAEGRRVSHVLIPRNVPLPVTASTTVLTCYPNQRRATIRVVETATETDLETDLETDTEPEAGNVVCKCSIDNLPEGLPAESVFDLELGYDADGLLHVIARHRDSGRLATVSKLFSPERVA